MEKHIGQWSYWLGLACTLLAMVWRGLEFLNVMPEGYGDLKYTTLYKGGLLFLVMAIATSSLVAAKGQKV
jgi:predicted Na+-dependent transporter